MSCDEYPRLSGPMQRGSEAWTIRSAARTARERTHRDDQAVIDHGRPPKVRGLQAFRCAGAIRTVAHVLRRALPGILDVPYPRGQLRPGTTCAPWLFDRAPVAALRRSTPAWVRGGGLSKPNAHHVPGAPAGLTCIDGKISSSIALGG